MNNQIEADVCIVGSGVAGAVVARHCVDSGLNVAMIEAGPRANGRAIGLRALERLFRDYRIPRMRFWHRHAMYAKADDLTPNYKLSGRALIVRGGTTLGWTGDAYRMLPEDFELCSRTGHGRDWPIDYDELEPHYAAAETTLRVAGDHSDPGHPPRSTLFPAVPLPFQDRDVAFLDECQRFGSAAMHHNVAHAQDGSVFAGDELIDELEQLSGFKLLVSTVAQRIECVTSDVADTVACVDTAGGQAVSVHARTIVVCAGGIESPNLLLNSRNRWWPEGLGNRNGHVGCHLTTHGGVAIGGRPRGLRYFDGPVVATAASRQHDTPHQQGRGKFLLISRPAPTGYMFLNAVFEQFSNPANSVRPAVERAKFGMPKSEIRFELGDRFRKREREIAGQLEQMARRLRLPVTKRRNYMLAHHMCTARMSSDPVDGVVDENLRVHSMRNLYVCGGANFASVAAASPTVTIAALAHRLGIHLAHVVRA